LETGAAYHAYVADPENLTFHSASAASITTRPGSLGASLLGLKTGESKTIPSGGGEVRNMAATKDGRLYLACSGGNKVPVATIR